MELAKVQPDLSIDFQGTTIQVRTLLRKTLAPLGLKAVVTDDGLLVAADMAELARRGIGTDQWVNLDSAFADRIEKAMNQPVSFNFEEIPLPDAVRAIAEMSELPILIDTNAIEACGMSVDNPISANLSNTSLRSFFNIIFQNTDLIATPQNEVLMVTTREYAQENLLVRMYWLDGLVSQKEELKGLVESIQNSIEPDCWDVIGGSSTMVASFQNDRPAVVVATTYQVHHDLKNFLEVLRQPVRLTSSDVQNPPAKKPVIVPRSNPTQKSSSQPAPGPKFDDPFGGEATTSSDDSDPFN